MASVWVAEFIYSVIYCLAEYSEVFRQGITMVIVRFALLVLFVHAPFLRCAEHSPRKEKLRFHLCTNENERKWEEFLSACKGNESEVVAELLKERPDFLNKKTPDEFEGSGLLRTAIYGALDVATLLLEQKANIEICNATKETALHKATEFGHAAIVSLLLSRGANVEAKTRFGETPWDYANRDYLKRPNVIDAFTKHEASRLTARN